MRLLRDLRPEAHITSLHLLLETVATNAQGLRDLLVEQLDNPGLFTAGWYGADGHSAGLTIASALPWQIEAERARAEAELRALRPEISCAKPSSAPSAAATDEPQPPCHTPSTALYAINHS